MTNIVISIVFILLLILGLAILIVLSPVLLIIWIYEKCDSKCHTSREDKKYHEQ